jgi:DNA-binding transcriptional LysR family regulator
MQESLDSRQLNAFVALAKSGSHSAAAKKLCLTHSAISHSIRALEEQVGCRLFSKLGKKVTLTEAGDALLVHAERALSEMCQARITLAGLNKWGSRRVRLAVETIFPSHFLAPVLLNFHRGFPASAIQVESCPAGAACALLERVAVDLVLAARPPSLNGYEFLPLLADRFHLVANADHPLAVKANPTRADFAGRPCLLLRGCGHERKTLEHFPFLRDLELNITGEVEDAETVKSLVKSTPLLSLLPGWLIAAELRNRSLVSLRFGRKAIEQDWGLIHNLGRPLNHAESMLWRFCGQAVATLT